MTNPNPKHSQAYGHSHMGMMVLCVALMAGAFLYFSGSSAENGLGLSLLAPLLVCVGAHFLMHRFMGHGEAHPSQTQEHEKQESTLKSKPQKQVTPPRITPAN